MCSIAPENVILFIGVARRLHLFVGEYPTSISTSSIGRVVCESSPIIQLFSYLLDKNSSITFSGAMCSIAPENVILFIGVARRLHLFVGKYPTSISTSSIGRVVCKSSPSIQLFSYLLNKNSSITFSGAMYSIAPENVILFIEVARRLHLFVGKYPTSISTSSIGRVVCESSPIIQLFSYLLDKKSSITFSGAMCSIAVPSLLKM